MTWKTHSAQLGSSIFLRYPFEDIFQQAASKFGGLKSTLLNKSCPTVVARELYPIVKIRKMSYSAQIKDLENLQNLSIFLGLLMLGLIK